MKKLSRTLTAVISLMLTLVLLAQPIFALEFEELPDRNENGLELEIIEDGNHVYVESDERIPEGLTDAELFGIPKNFDGSFYNQLTTRGKKFFDTLETMTIKKIKSAKSDSGGYKQLETIMNGVSGMQFTGTNIGGTLSLDTASKQRQRELFTDLAAAVTAFRYDRPDALWTTSMKYGYTWRVSGNVGTLDTITFSFFLHYNGIEENMWDVVNENANLIVKQIKSRNLDRYNQVRFIHDFLMYKNDYAKVLSDKAYHPQHLAYSSLAIDNAYDPVCDGYAKGFKIVADKLDIPCALASSNSGNHMWNNVQMENGKWYNVDVTWDDTSGETYNYFLVGSKTRISGTAFDEERSHKEENPYISSGPNDDFPIVFTFPVKNESAYSYTGTVQTFPEFPTLLASLKSLSRFPDVLVSAWYYNAVEKSYELGIFKGDQNGKFNPSKNITRAEFAQAMANYKKADLENYKYSSFTDVPGNSWAAPATSWAYKNGIMQGSKGKFRPNDPITREEMCVVFRNMDDGNPGTYTKFPDDASISSWARDAVYYCKNIGIVSGDSKTGNFRPRGNTLRSEAATVFVKYAEQD